MTNEDKSKEQLLDEIKELKQKLAKAKKLDKSHLKDANKEIEKSHSEYSLLFNNMTAGVAIHEMLYDDNGKACDYRFLQVNPAFEKMTGLKTDKLIGKRVKEVMPDTEEYWIEKFGKVAETGKMESFQNYSAELNKYYDVCAFSPKKGFFAVTIMNVTERILAEKKLLASNQQIMAANQQLSASEQQLRAANQQLSASEQQLRAANQQLVKSEIKNQSMLENSPVCTKIVDLDCNLQYMSCSGVKALHIDDITEFYGKPYPLSFYPAPFKTLMTKNLKEVKKTGEIITQEALAVDMNGNDLWFHSTLVPVYDYNDKLDYIMVASLDTTKRKQAEEALEKRIIALTQPLNDEENINFENLFNLDDIQLIQDGFANSTEVASIITTPDGTPITKPSNFCELCNDIIRKTKKGCANCQKSDAIIGEVNEDGATIQICKSGGLWDAGAAIMVGKKHIANWLIGQVRNEAQSEEKIRQYAHEIDADENKVVKAFRKVNAMSFEKFQSIADTLYTLANQISKSAYQNVQQARFITKNKLTAKKLKDALEKAQESDRLKSAFLANMSHEIRTPMNGILGFIELLNTPELSDEKKQEFTEIIKKSSDRLLNTINDLIDISKIEAKQVGISNSEVNVNELLKELYDFFTPAIEAKGLSLISLPAPAKNQTTVFTDDDKLHGILRNLINNAIKHTDKGSISYGYTSKDKHIEFFVKDTGIGVAKNRHKAIFDRFVQADIEDARAFEGSGLGLAIAKAYVEMMGGKIWLESEEGKGTEFLFTIPYKNNINKEIDSKPKTAKDTYIKKTFKDMTILIADDDNVTSLYYDAILQSKFQKIIYVKNGKEAIETVKNNSEIDIILMDIKMPKIDGYEATQKIRKFNKDIIIIAQTAYALEGEKEKAFKAGCDDYLSKPINEEKLFKAIETILDKKK